MGVGQLSESDAVDALRLPFYSSSHPTGSHGWRNQFDLGNTRRDQIAQGRSSGELIDAGFAPGTVYKVQRQVRGKSPASHPEPEQLAASTHPQTSGPADPDWWPSLDDLVEEDDCLVLYGLINDFPRLSERVEGKLEGASNFHGTGKFLTETPSAPAR